MEKDKKLMFKPLRISFIKKNFVKNYQSNYEEYLTEFINNSKFVPDKGDKEFSIVIKQSSGEPDIKNEYYELDYKLLIDNKTMEGLKYYSENIRMDSNGGVVFSSSEKRGVLRRYLLTNIMKNMSKDDFLKLENQNSNILNEFEILVKHYLDKITVNKNVLYFLPYYFFYENTIMGYEEYIMLADKFSEDLKGFIEYRNEKTKNDTYLCFFVKENIVFLKYTNRFILYDVVRVNVSEKYMKLVNISNFLDYSFLED